jgi:hypothetical protein
MSIEVTIKSPDCGCFDDKRQLELKDARHAIEQMGLLLVEQEKRHQAAIATMKADLAEARKAKHLFIITAQELEAWVWASCVVVLLGAFCHFLDSHARTEAHRALAAFLYTSASILVCVFLTIVVVFDCDTGSYYFFERTRNWLCCRKPPAPPCKFL